MPARASPCPAPCSRWAPRPASTSASRAPTSRSPPASPLVSRCACSTRPARKPRSRWPITTPTSGMRSCRASARGRPTGTGSAAPGTRPGACGATRPSCCSTPTPRRSAERSPSGRRCSARTQPTPASRAPWTPPGTCPGAWSWTRRSAGRTASAPGTGTRTRWCTRSTSRASPCAIRTSRAELRGTYAGLGHEAAIAYLKDLGVTTVELLPVHQNVPESFLVAEGLTNYWGYNTIGFLAPHNGYSAAVPGRPGGRAGRGVQDDGGRAAPGGPGSDPGRGVQPHRRSRAGRSRAVLPRPRQPGLLPGRSRRPRRLLRHHRLRQLPQRRRPDHACS